MALNANALTLLTTAKDHLDVPVDNNLYDDRIERMINQASGIIAGHTGRVLVNATHTEIYDGRRSNRIILNQYPITGGSATGGKPELWINSNGDFSGDPVDPANYSFNDNEIVYIRGFSKGTANIQVIYQSGLGKIDSVAQTNTLPSDLELACLDTVLWLYTSNTDRRIGLTSVSKSDESAAYFLGLPPHIEAILDANYTRLELPALAPVGVKNT